MPKSRSSGNIASGAAGAQSGGAAASAEELAERLGERLNQLSSVIVPSYSRSRGGVENTRVNFVVPGEATVESESGSRYHVDYINDFCDCPQHRFRGGRCRHIDAVHQAIGEEERAPLANPGPMDIGNAVEGQRDIDIQAEEQRQNIQNIAEDDGYFYSDNEEEFQRAMERGMAEPLPYEYENVLNGSQNTFGIELEFVGGNADAIARELYELGICAHDRRVGYHSSSVPGKWKLERDGTVSEGRGGGELVSPVLKDTPQTWRNLQTICDVAKRHGARINQKCGAHVHFGMDPLDTARQRWKRFFRSIAGFEDIIYRMAGGSLGRIRSGYSQYASPFVDRARRGTRNFRMESIDDVYEVTRNISTNRYHGINLTNIYNFNKPNTVEFRYFNGSLDAAQIQANVKIANSIMVASEKARARGDETPDTMKRRGKMLLDHPTGSGAVNRSDHSAIKKFVDIFFNRKKDKDCAIAVYSKNQWRE